MKPVTVVIDTNVVVSAFLNAEGLERWVVDLVINRRIRMVFTHEILREYRSVLARKKFSIETHLRDEALSLIEGAGTLIQVDQAGEDNPLSSVDPKDTPFISCALSCQADYLVTGNLRHFPPMVGTTKVTNAREFLNHIFPSLLEQKVKRKTI